MKLLVFCGLVASVRGSQQGKIYQSKPCTGDDCQVSVGCPEGEVPISCEAHVLKGSNADGAYWSALEGTGIKCIAQGAAGAKVVQAQITCVPATGREVYYVQESAGRKGGYPDILGKVGQITASCRSGYKAIACNCISHWQHCPQSTWVDFSPSDSGVCQVTAAANAGGVGVSALCAQIGDDSPKASKYHSTPCKGDDCRTSVGCPEGKVPIKCEAHLVGGKQADGAVWSKLHGSDMKCVAQGSSDNDSVQAQITCVPATAVSRDFYVKQSSTYGNARHKIGTITAKCKPGYEVQSCNCISAWRQCPGSSWVDFAPNGAGAKSCSVEITAEKDCEACGAVVSALCVSSDSTTKTVVVGPIEYTAFPSKLVTQGDAEATCNIRGGHLAAIHSTEQQTAVAKLISQFNSVRVPAFWIGSQLVSEGTGTTRSWKWSDGTYFKYKNWTPGQPQKWVAGSPEEEQCTMMNTAGGKWDDEMCSHVRPFICQRFRPGVCDCHDPNSFHVNKDSNPDASAYVVTANMDDFCGRPCQPGQGCGDGCSCATRRPGCYSFDATSGCAHDGTYGKRVGDFCPYTPPPTPPPTTTTTHPPVPYTKRFNNFCVSSTNVDLPQTNAPSGDKSIETCVAQCRKTKGCTAIEWYDSGWAGSKCKWMLGKVPATQGRPTGRRWQDAQCFVLEPLPATTTTPDTAPPQCRDASGQSLKLSSSNGKEEFCTNIDAEEFKQLNVGAYNRDDVCEVHAYTKGTTCSQWCRTHGMYCIYAEDNIGDTCKLDPNFKRQSSANNGCDQKWNDQVCGCVKAENRPVATVYEDFKCSGKKLILREKDFLAGRNKGAWDACNEKYDDGTKMTYQATARTWLKSIQVFDGYTIKTANKCNDDYNYDTPAGGGITIGTTLTSTDGCKDQHTDFNYVEFKSKVAKGSDLPVPCQNLKLGPGEIICSKITNKDLTALDTSRINRDLACEVYARTNGKNCAQWCESKGLHCMYAQDNKGDQCTLDPRILRQESTGNGCYQEYGDQVCACAPLDVDTICKKGYYEQAPQVTYIVNAKNSAPATTGLKTGTNVQQGDFITIGANPTDCWSAGSTVRTSDANGLGACTKGTACVDSCNTQFGKYTSGGSSFFYGSLVGRIGTTGPWFKIGTSFEGAMPKSGTLYLGFWDSSYGDNKGTIQVTISGTLRTSDGQRSRAEGTCEPCKKSCSKPCFRDLGLSSKQCPVQQFSFMKAADCDAHGCQCQGCKTSFSKPPTKTRVTPKKRVCKPTKYRRLSHSQCFYSSNDNPMWGGGGFLSGEKTFAECQACCSNSPGCVAFEWSSHSTDPNTKARCAFAWGCERVAGWDGGDAFLSNCARRGTAYKAKDQKGSYSTAKCDNKPPPKPKKKCQGSDFLGAGKGGNSDPFAVMQWCSAITSKSKVCDICACVSELNPRAVRRSLDCNVNDVSFLKVYSAHRNCKPCSFSHDGPVVVHG